MNWRLRRNDAWRRLLGTGPNVEDFDTGNRQSQPLCVVAVAKCRQLQQGWQ